MTKARFGTNAAAAHGRPIEPPKTPKSARSHSSQAAECMWPLIFSPKDRANIFHADHFGRIGRPAMARGIVRVHFIRLQEFCEFTKYTPTH